MLTVAISISTGIVADRFLDVDWRCWLLAALLGLFTCLSVRRRYYRIAVTALLVSIVTLAAAWHQLDWAWYRQDQLAFRLDEESRPVCLDATVLSSPRLLAVPLPDPLCSFPQQQMSRLRLRIRQVRDGDCWIQASGDATLLVAGDVSHISCGDLVRVFGFARRPRGRLNPGLNMPQGMRGRREIFQLRATAPEALRRLRCASRWSPRVWMENLRGRICRSLERQLGPADAPLAEAMLVGEREQVTADQRDAFFLTGTIHLLAISGLHLGLLAGVFWMVTRAGFVNRQLGLLLGIAFVLFYCWLTGGRPPIMRATILVTVLCLAELSFRPTLPVNVLATAAVLVLAIDPSSLFQAGTQLSFVAVLGLLRCHGMFAVPSEPRDPLEKLLQESRPWPFRLAARLLLNLRRALLLSLAVWSITAPLVLYYFHLVSPVGILLGLALGIPLAVVLVSGMATILLSGLGWLALLAAIPLKLGLGMMKWIIALARDWPAAYFWSPAPPGWQLVVFYGLLFLGWSCRKRVTRRCLRIALVAWVVVAAVSTTRVSHRPGNDRMRVTFIAVGHGTSVLLELPGDRVWLYDAGHLGRPGSAGRQVAGVLWSRGIRQIDRLLLSHADIDHFNAVPFLLERFRVKQVCVPVPLDWDASPAIRALARELERHQVPVRSLKAGDELLAGERLSARVLHPPADVVPGSDNAGSLVLEVGWGASRLLLPGDLEADGLALLLGSPPRHASVLMAPHHGSIHSDPLAVCRWCRPRLVVISSGDRQASGEPAYRQWGSPLAATRRQGAITIDFLPGGFCYRGERDHPP
jgi:competence protein ComEC